MTSCIVIPFRTDDVVTAVNILTLPEKGSGSQGRFFSDSGTLPGPAVQCEYQRRRDERSKVHQHRYSQSARDGCVCWMRRNLGRPLPDNTLVGSCGRLRSRPKYWSWGTFDWKRGKGGRCHFAGS